MKKKMDRRKLLLYDRNCEEMGMERNGTFLLKMGCWSSSGSCMEWNGGKNEKNEPLHIL